MSTQLLINVFRVPAVGTLAVGDSITLPHGLRSNDTDVAPTLVQPDRGSPIVVTAVTDTTVTFENQGAGATFAFFRCERGLSNEVDAETVTPSLWQGAASGGGGGIVAVNATSPLASSNPAGPVTTLSLDPSGVTDGTYGSAATSPESLVPQIGVDALGRVTTASQAAIRIGGSTAKDYVDAAAAAAQANAEAYAQTLAFGIASKEPAHLATTDPLPAYTATTLTLTADAPYAAFPNIDGHPLAVGERLLVKSETGAEQKNNGIYELTDAGSALTPWILTRTADADTAQELCGSLVSVEIGTVNGGTLWLFAANANTFDLGVDPVIWEPISVPNATTTSPGAVQLSAGLGGAGTAYNAPKLDMAHATSGTLSVARGGTGATALTARAVTVVNAAGTALATVSPGAAGNVLKSNGTDWVSGGIPTDIEAQVFYVAVDGNDANDGSAAAPFATIQYAIDTAAATYTSGEKVVIVVGPGTFSTSTKITLGRYNTFISGQGKRPEDVVTTITDPIEIDCPTATQLYNEQVGIDGCFVAPGAGFTDPAIGVTGSGQFSTVITNCYVTTSNAASSASAIRSVAAVGRVITWNCILTVQAAAATAFIVDLGDGTHKIGDTQIQHSSAVLNTATSKAFALAGASYAFLDRVLIETRTNQYQIVINGTPYSGSTQMVLSNASISTNPTIAPLSSGIDHSGAGLLLMTDVFFTIPAARLCVNAATTSPIAYGQLSFAVGYSTSIVSTVTFYNNEAHGEMYLNALTASLPLKLDASKKMISQAINLSGAEVTGTLAIANGGTGNGSTVTANTVFAGPSTGAPGAPSYRALVAADIPAIPASGITGIPYDIAGAVAGVPTILDTIFRFVAVRACTIAATGHQALCAVAPASNTDFDIQLNGSSIGTIAYTSAGTTGTVTITSGLPVSVAIGDRVEIVAPSAVNGINSPFFTLAAVL